jgi:hypothetical protein
MNRLFVTVSQSFSGQHGHPKESPWIRNPDESSGAPIDPTATHIRQTPLDLERTPERVLWMI